MEQIEDKKAHQQTFRSLRTMVALYQENEEVVERYLDILVKWKAYLEEKHGLDSDLAIELIKAMR